MIKAVVMHRAINRIALTHPMAYLARWLILEKHLKNSKPLIAQIAITKKDTANKKVKNSVAIIDTR